MYGAQPFSYSNFVHLCLVVFFCLSIYVGTAQHDAEVRLKANLFKNYSKEVLPPHGNSFVQVKVGLSIISIGDVDPKSQELYTNVWLKLEWKDSRLKWDEQAYNNLLVLHVPPQTVWKPDIALYNSAHSHGPDLSSSKVYTLLYPNGLVVWIPPLTLYSNCELDLKFYPYDIHQCKFTFGSWTHSAHDIQLELYGNLSKADLSDALNKGGEWEIINTRALVNTTYYECCQEPYSDANFFITIRRRSPFYRATILCPVVTVVLLILTSFWISPVAREKIAINLVSLVTLVLLLMHFARNLPAVGTTAPLIVTTCAVLLFVTVLVMAQSIFFHGFLMSHGHQETPRFVNLLLNSRVAKLFCISTPVSFAPLDSAIDPSNLFRDDESKRHRGSPQTPTQNQWILFMQIFDRFLFAVFLIVIFSLLIAAAT